MNTDIDREVLLLLGDFYFLEGNGRNITVQNRITIRVSPTVVYGLLIYSHTCLRTCIFPFL